jgi:hypothetical protein
MFMKRPVTQLSTNKPLSSTDRTEQRTNTSSSRGVLVEFKRPGISNRHRQTQEHGPSAMKETKKADTLRRFQNSREEPDPSIHELSQDDLFDIRFLRCCPSLRYIANRILNSKEAAEEAVMNSFFIASCSPLQFRDEGAFRSWLIRILIDEALLLQRETK